jgi:hypothetical protein
MVLGEAVGSGQWSVDMAVPTDGAAGHLKGTT